METDGRQSRAGDRELSSDENVVRLPRDWLGPRDELVPIGPASRARARAAGLLDDDPLDDLPPTAHDFWGEDSAALHDAIQGPARADPAPADAEPVSVAAARRPRFPSPRLGRPRLGSRWDLAGVRELRLKWLALVLPIAVAVIAVAVIAVAVTAGTGSPSHRARVRAAEVRSLPVKAHSTRSASAGTEPPVIIRSRSERPSVTRVAHRGVHHHARTPRSAVATASRSHYVSSSTAAAATRAPAPTAGATRTVVQSSAPSQAPTSPPVTSLQPSAGATASTAHSSSTTNQRSRSTGDSAATLLGGIGSCVKGC